MNKFLLLLLITLTSTTSGAGSELCRELFGISAIENKINSLAELRLKLDLAQSSNKDTLAYSLLARDYTQKESELLNHIEAQRIMSREELREKIKLQIASIQKVKLEETQRNENANRNEYLVTKAKIGGRAVFHKIYPGHVYTSYGNDPIRRVEIFHPFEMMSTPTTQIIWREVAELANRELGTKFNLSPSDYQQAGDLRPVDSVSYVHVYQWMAALNKLSDSDVPELLDIIPSHKQGDRYRLPTGDQFEFVIQGGGKFKDDKFTNDTDVTRYSWVAKNSRGTTNDVGLLEPIAFDDAKFYDLFGNVWEWVKSYDIDKVLDDLQDLSKLSQSRASVRGGANSTKSFENGGWGGMGPLAVNKSVGFRLIREVRKP